MATTVYLIRENRQFVAQSGVEEVLLTGSTKPYDTVTGVAATDVITIPGNTLVNNDSGFFTYLVGGAGLAVNTTFWVINKSGNTIQLSATRGGAAINFTTDITAAQFVHSVDDLVVWSAEFRNTFQSSVSVPSASAAGTINAATITSPGTYSIVGAKATVVYDIASPVPQFFVEPEYAVQSDEVAGVPLRQSPLRKTHWRFDFGDNVTPRYLYAEWLTGDTLANNPPNTIVSA